MLLDRLGRRDVRPLAAGEARHALNHGRTARGLHAAAHGQRAMGVSRQVHAGSVSPERDNALVH